LVAVTGIAFTLAPGQTSFKSGSQQIRQRAGTGATMIIVLGSIVAKPDSLQMLLALSIEHVHRSRAEPGCIAHDVHIDQENPLKLVFVEKWNDAETLGAHFKLKDSINFVAQARPLAAGAPVIEIFVATPQKF
jgi:quinol monooxygenase YgiN